MTWEIPGEAILRTGYFSVEPPIKMRARGYPWDHEIRVALPRSYHRTATTYPVLWVTDNVLETALVSLGHAELILVSIGADASAGWAWSPRRAYDFYPVEDIFPPGPTGDLLRRQFSPAGQVVGGGADAFLEFLISDVRPMLEATYRIDPEEHGLEGFSAGGWFVLYALLERPQAFRRYLAVAPALYFCNNLIFDIEEQYACQHEDLPADLFLGVGDGEMTVGHMVGCFSSTAKMVEMLSFRAYRSLEMTVKIFQGESHGTVLASAIGAGARFLWGDKIAPETSSERPHSER